MIVHSTKQHTHDYCSEKLNHFFSISLAIATNQVEKTLTALSYY